MFNKYHCSGAFCIYLVLPISGFTSTVACTDCILQLRLPEFPSCYIHLFPPTEAVTGVGVHMTRGFSGDMTKSWDLWCNNWHLLTNRQVSNPFFVVVSESWTVCLGLHHLQQDFTPPLTNMSHDKHTCMCVFDSQSRTGSVKVHCFFWKYSFIMESAYMWHEGRDVDEWTEINKSSKRLKKNILITLGR